MASTTVAPSSTPATNGATSAHPASGYSSVSLYVGDLDPNVTEMLLYEMFNAIGPVLSVRVCRDINTRRSLGYAYVNFQSVVDAEKALDMYNFKPINGRPCRIMWKQSDPMLRRTGAGNVFVKNLEKSIDNQTLYDTFSIFGNILSCKVATDPTKGSLGYGFVHFETAEIAQDVIAKADGKVVKGAKISVSLFKPKAERATSTSKFTNVYVNNMPAAWEEKNMVELFTPYGSITSSMLSKLPEAKDGQETPSHFGFVNFSTPEEAAKAVSALNGKDIGNGVTLFVGRAQTKEERSKELKGKFDAARKERQRKFTNVNLYVKNLSEEVDDEKLRGYFAKFGSITSAVVKKDESGKSRGFGFVCFATPEEANKAVLGMNGQTVDNKPLYVALFQPRDVRRQQLEVQHQHRLKVMGPHQQMYAQQMFPQMQMRGNYQMFPMMHQQPRMHPGMFPGGGMMGPGGYQLMPVNQQFMGGRGGMRNGPGRQRQPGHPGPHHPQQQHGQGKPQGAVRFSENVRNQGAPAQVAPQQPQKAPEGSHTGINVSVLAAASEEQKKRLIGEQLYRLVHTSQPQLAGKITGMLLDMENGELLNLLESKEALDERIAEALDVLRNSGAATA